MLKFWEVSNEQNLTEQKIVLTTILTRLSANKSSDREPFYLKIGALWGQAIHRFHTCSLDIQTSSSGVSCKAMQGQTYPSNVGR